MNQNQENDQYWIDRAIKAYVRFSQQLKHLQVEQPSRELSEVVEYIEGDFIALRNVNGLLALYRIKWGESQIGPYGSKTKLQRI